MDSIDLAIEETERLLLQAKTTEVKNALRKTYFKLLKKKFGALSETSESGELGQPREPRELKVPKEPSETREPKEDQEEQKDQGR
jgi:hypothetical protein